MIGLVLLGLIIYDLTKQFSKLSNLDNYKSEMMNAISSNGWGYLILVLALMFTQWLIEAVRWKIVTASIQPMNILTALKMVFTGSSFSLVTPNRTGDFIGKIMHIPSDKRAAATALSFYGSFLQWIIYCLFGTLSLFLLDLFVPPEKMPLVLSKSIYLLKWISPFLITGAIALLLSLGWVSKTFGAISFVKKFEAVFQHLSTIKISQIFLMSVLTMLRTFVFVFQYVLIFTWLGVDLQWYEVFLGITIMVYGLAILPTLSFFEIGLRLEFSYYLFSLFTANLFAITVGTTIIYIVNIVFPAIIGSFWLIFKPKSVG